MGLLSLTFMRQGLRFNLANPLMLASSTLTVSHYHESLTFHIA